jgi:hypothetical protein
VTPRPYEPLVSGARDVQVMEYLPRLGRERWSASDADQGSLVPVEGHEPLGVLGPTERVGEALPHRDFLKGAQVGMDQEGSMGPPASASDSMSW